MFDVVVKLLQVCVLSKMAERIIDLVFARELPFTSLVVHCVQKKFRISSKIMVLSSVELCPKSQTPDIENFASVCH